MFVLGSRCGRLVGKVECAEAARCKVARVSKGGWEVSESFNGGQIGADPDPLM